METRTLGMHTRTEMGRVGGGGKGFLTWASGYNFPLFLVYPVDMPDLDRKPRDTKLKENTQNRKPKQNERK